jgi:hypothetical protein
VCVFNNTSGDDDDRVRRHYNEPAWNNPVVRIVDAEGNDLIPRVSGDYSARGLVHAMTAALVAQERAAPEWFRLLAQELDARARGAEQTVFAMSCFWQGEVHLGGVDGVIATRAGFLQGREVVEVTFDPARVAYGDLVAKAREMSCATTIFARSDAQARIAGAASVRTNEEIRSDREPKYWLLQTALSAVPMTALQGARVNARVALRGDPSELLSPSQRALAAAVQRLGVGAFPVAVDAPDLIAAWDTALALAGAR